MINRSRLLAGCALAWAATAALPALAQTAIEPPPNVVVVEPAPTPTPDVVVVEPAPTPTPAPTPAPEPVIVVTDPNAGRFDALPTGERKIAQSLYDAQTQASTAWTRDDIAAARGNGGWGQVFRSMQADGVVQARNLGQVISAGNHQATMPRQTPVTISYGNGASTTSGTVTTGHRHADTISTGHRHTATTTVTTASGGAGMTTTTTHGNSHSHAATVAASTTSAAGGTASGHGGGHGQGKGKH